MRRYHIGHPIFWRSGREGSTEHPSPGTKISSRDIEDNIWVPRDPTLLEFVKNYARVLETRNRLQICIWPEHCIIGSRGHRVVAVIREAVERWIARQSESLSIKRVHYILKGMNPRIEMYSALAAEVEDVSDPSTSYDRRLLAELAISDRILVCGQALTHTLNYTTRDMCSQLDPRKVTVLLDGTSALTGYDDERDAFLRDMAALGVTLTTTTSVFSSS